MERWVDGWMDGWMSKPGEMENLGPTDTAETNQEAGCVLPKVHDLWLQC